MPGGDLKLKTLATIQGTSFQAIEAALDIVERQRIGIDRFNIRVYGTEEPSTVFFLPYDAQQDRPPSYGVRLDTAEEVHSGQLKELYSKIDASELRDRIEGSHFQAMQIAFQRFKQHELDIERYKLQLVQEGDRWTVLFLDKDRKPNARGGGGLPGFEVELSLPDRKPVRSSFVR